MSADFGLILLRATLALTVALLVVMPARRWLRRAAGARIAYAAWLAVPAALVAACLPMPAMPLLPAPLPLPWQHLGDAAAIGTGPAGGPAWPLLVWLAGVLAATAIFARRQQQFLRELAGGQKFPGAGPAVIGLWRPRIVLPGDFERHYSEEERVLVLEHENQHLRRGDVPAQAFCLLLRCLFWFHPLVHAAAARFRFDQELACDAAVLARFPHARRRYGEAMLKTQLAGQSLPVGCHWQACHPLKERFAMLKHNPPGVVRRRLGIVLVAALVGAVSAAAWAGQPGAAAVTPTLQSVTDGDQLAAPKYPRSALDQDISGHVVLDVLVAADGSVSDVKVVDSKPAGVFDEAASAAARDWRFSPGARTSTGEPVSGWVRIPVQFRADGEPPTD